MERKDNTIDGLYTDIAVSYVRGRLGTSVGVCRRRSSVCVNDLTDDEKKCILSVGKSEGLKLYRFKRSSSLPRVKAVLGVLKGIRPGTLLDVGSGRGVFLWPLLNEFPELKVMATDVLDGRVRDMMAVKRGGDYSLSPCLTDVTALGYRSSSVDVVTALEVLEHIPDVEKAVQEICRIAGRWVIVSVPSKEDTNPEHIHLLKESNLRKLFNKNGIKNVRFTYVLNHLIALAGKDYGTDI